MTALWKQLHGAITAQNPQRFGDLLVDKLRDCCTLKGKVMNIGKALGKFGAVLVDVITFLKKSLTSVSDEFAEWLGTESGKSALRTVVSVGVKSLVAAYEEFKQEAAKLFTPAGEFNFPGSAGKWRASEFFTTANEKTKFWYVDSSLLNFLGAEEIDGSPARRLTVQQLRWDAKDEEILPQVGDLTPAEFRWTLEKGNLQIGRWYAGYITHLGVRRAVVFDLDDNGLRVLCYPVPGADAWNEGCRFVSPQSLVRTWVPRPLFP